MKTSQTSLQQIQDAIQQRRHEIAALELAASLLGSHNGNGHAPARVSSPPRPRQRRLPKAGEPGLEADVISVLEKARKPLKGGEVCDLLAKRPSDKVIATLRVLAKSGAVVRSGATSSMRYAAPQFAGDVH